MCWRDEPLRLCATNPSISTVEGIHPKVTIALLTAHPVRRSIGRTPLCAEKCAHDILLARRAERNSEFTVARFGVDPATRRCCLLLLVSPNPLHMVYHEMRLRSRHLTKASGRTDQVLTDLGSKHLVNETSVAKTCERSIPAHLLKETVRHQLCEVRCYRLTKVCKSQYSHNYRPEP